MWRKQENCDVGVDVGNDISGDVGSEVVLVTERWTHNLRNDKLYIYIYIYIYIYNRPNRRQIQKGKLRSEQRMLKRRLKEAPIHERPELQNILNDIQKRILVISRAENQRKHRKKKRQARRAFFSNPYAFAKKNFSWNQTVASLMYWGRNSRIIWRWHTQMI